MTDRPTPYVSIIMAAKDTEPYLPACIDSIIAQTFTNWELIAINDHSSDRTPEIIQAYADKDPRVKLVHSDRPKLIPTLKAGYKHASGTLINRMDSDDKMPPDKLEVLVNEWEQYGKGHLIAGGTQHFVDEGEVGGGFLRYEEWLNEVARTHRHYEEIYKECVIPSHCWIMHREDFEAADGFNPEVYPEDYDLTFRLYRNKMKVIGIDKILHYWRDRSNRISRTWEEYKDNRYFDMKLRYFYDIDRDRSRPLVVWGCGRNGKDMVKRILTYEQDIHWVCDSESKVGKDIYGITVGALDKVPQLDHPQIMIVIASPEAEAPVRAQLAAWGKEKVKDYWFFL